MKDFGLYLVMTDPVVGYEKCCEAAVKAEVAMVQLRMKSKEREISRSEVLDMAKKLAGIVKGSKTKLIIDDDPSVAADSGADGVHVGQDDIPAEMIRNRWPEIPYIGLSTHNPAQAEFSIALKPDYIGVGPIFPTPTKKIPDPVLGLEDAGRMISSVPYAAVAIGGITADNLPSVIMAGARSWAVVRAVCASDDPYAAIMELNSVSGATLAALAQKPSVECIA